MAAHTGPGLTGNTLTVDTTAGGVQVVASASYQRTLVIQNIDSANPIFLGGTSSAALTAANGFRIAAGESFSVDIPPFSEIYAISAGSVEARFLVVDGLRG